MTSNCRHLALTVWQYNLPAISLLTNLWGQTGMFYPHRGSCSGQTVHTFISLCPCESWMDLRNYDSPVCQVDSVTEGLRRLTVVVRVAMWHLPGWRDSHRVALSSTTSVDTLGHAPGLWEAVKWSDKSNMNNLKQLLRPDSIVNNNNNNNDTVSQILNKRKGRLQTLRLSVAECSRHHNPVEIFLLFKFCSTKSNWIQF